MGKLLPLGLGLMLLPVAASALTPQQEAVGRHFLAKTTPLGMMQKAKAGAPLSIGENLAGARRAVSATPFLTNTGLDNLGYIDGPNGESWFYTVNYDIEEVVNPGYTDYLIKGYEITVYDSTHKLVGTVKDAVAFEEDDVRVASLSVDAMVSKKFFNIDDKYELIVNIAMNRPDYSIRSFAQVYSIGATPDEDGNTPVVTTLPGYICMSVNTATSSWDENFYIGVLTQTGYDESLDDFAEYAASNKNIITIYKKSGYSGGPQEISRLEVANPNLPGDQMSVPYIMADVRDGKAFFVFQHYEKWFFKNAIGPGIGLPGETEEDGMPFLDNNLIIETYSCSAYGSTLTPEKTIKIPVDQTCDNPDIKFSYYSIGQLLYTDDLMADGSSNVCIQRYQISDDDNYLTTYAKYDADGKKVKDIATDIDGYMLMNDIRGHESQVMFIKPNTEGSYDLDFVDLPSCTKVLSLPATYQNFMLRANVDRFPVENSYEYAFQTAQSNYDAEGNILEKVLWINADGDISHIDELNLGKDIAMAQVYIEQSALSPYVFDTDNNREYMWMVKRYRESGSSATDTHLYILSTNGSRLFEVGPDAEKGILMSVALINSASKPVLWVSYQNNSTSRSVYAQDFYALPLAKFAEGGNGTVENPYKIATVGDLEQMRTYPNAHFVLTNDIVADGVEFLPISAEFKGSLDGKGHKVTGLSVNGPGIFNDLNQGAVIKNINFVGARILSVSGSNAGLLASKASGTTISDVHIYGLDVPATDADFTFGGIIGLGSLGTTIDGCSVNSSTISLPNASAVGGIAGELRTGSKINGCAVKASITAESELGGIVGNIGGDNSILDCHTDIILSAGSVVGGIVGYNGGSPVARCYVEGSIKATGSKGSYYDNGPCAGGIVGSLKSSLTTSDTSGESETLKDPVIYNNFVNLTSLEGYTPAIAPTHSEQQKTLHRIAGRTQVNEEPNIIDYDANYEPIYGEPYAADARLINNYCISALEPVQDDIAAAANTTEGESVEASELSANWFGSKLGLEYGDGKHWNELAEADPALQHEGGNFCSPAALSVTKGDFFDIHVVFVGSQAVDMESIMDQFYYTSSNEDVAEMTGDATITKSRLAVRFEAKNVGTTTVDICGAKCEVTVTEPVSGVDSVISPAGSLVFDGSSVIAEGYAIAVYNVAGAQVAAGRDAVSVSNLAPGIYIAKAFNAESSVSAKFIVR